MKHLIVLLLLTLPLGLLSQNELVERLWCFEKDFNKSLIVGDTIVVNSFLVDNSPIQFNSNGKFERIKSPFRTCGNAPKPKRIDKIKGRWNMDGNQLSMTIDKKEMKFSFYHIDERKLVLVVEEI